MTGAVSFVVKIFTEALASVASMVVTALARYRRRGPAARGGVQQLGVSSS